MSKPESNDKVYLEHARRPDQREDMEDIAERDICFMCPAHIAEFYEQRDGLIDEGEHLYLVYNGYPYENTEYHLMAIPKEHLTTLTELREEFLVEALGFFQRWEQEYEVTGGAIAMRFGDPAETGATAHHAHIHFIVPSKNLGPNDQAVKFRMSPKFEQ